VNQGRSGAPVLFQPTLDNAAVEDEDLDDMNEAPGRRRRGIYLLPNLFTTGTLFGGFYAVIAAMNGDFSNAAVAIFVAMVADSLDGFIARKTNTASDFGKEYDSLCDMVAFGVAASLVIYSFSLHYLAEYRWLGGKLGWVAAFAYTACAALRLARFNVLATRGGAKGSFYGLPSPGAAAVVSGFVWVAHTYGLSGEMLVIPATIITLGTAALMVSNIRFFSLKNLKLTERVPFRYIVFVIGVLALFSINPPLIFFLLFFAYALSGPISAIWRRTRKPASQAV
jgi:CDP-diacylglycerol--serine O-phosphatidyltransferase